MIGKIKIYHCISCFTKHIMRQWILLHGYAWQGSMRILWRCIERLGKRWRRPTRTCSSFRSMWTSSYETNVTEIVMNVVFTTINQPEINRHYNDHQQCSHGREYDWISKIITDLSQVTDILYHIMLYTSPWSRFELTTVLIGTIWLNKQIGLFHFHYECICTYLYNISLW
jgi:hypothetical protein